MFEEHRFVIRAGGQDFRHPTGFRLKRSMNLMNADFEVSFIDPDLKIISSFRPGAEVEIVIDGLLLARFYVDALSIDDTNGHIYTCRGRDRTGDLIDCSARFSDGFELSNISLEGAISNVLAPFGIPLEVDADTGETFKKLSITPGDTVFNFIEQTCKFRAILPLADGIGGLILTKPGNIRSAGAIVIGENVVTRSGQIDHFQRFSNVTVLGQADAPEDPDAPAPKLSRSNGMAQDPDITRHRPLILQAEREGYDLSMKERAEWEVRHRRFSGTEITYTIPGWEAADGQFWTVNTLVPVRDPQLAIARDMMIKDVVLIRTQSGTQTQVTVAPAEAFDMPAMRQSGDDDVWGGGA